MKGLRSALFLGTLGAVLFAGCMQPPSSSGGGQLTQNEFLLWTAYFFILGFGIYYLLVLRPQDVAKEAEKQFIEGLKKGDEVLTAGGILARFVSAKEGIVTLELVGDSISGEIRSGGVRSGGVQIRVLEKGLKPPPSLAAAPAEKNADKSKTAKKS